MLELWLKILTVPLCMCMGIPWVLQKCCNMQKLTGTAKATDHNKNWLTNRKLVQVI